MSVNLVILQGNLGRDPELRYYPDGSKLVTFSIATNEAWKNRETGERVTHTEWHRCVAKRRTAEIASEYLREGSPAFIEGKNRTRKYQDANGADRWITEVVVTKLTLMGGKQGSETATDDEAGEEHDTDLGPHDL